MDEFNQYNDLGQNFNNQGYYNQDGQFVNQGMPMNQGMPINYGVPMNQGMPINQEMPPMKSGKFKKYKKRSGCLVRLLKFILIVVFIIFAFFFISNKLKVNKEKKEMDQYIETLPKMTVEEVMDEGINIMLQEPSDIKGLTKAQKLEMGFNYIDGSDTDGDGLSDKEEIEIYKTDPLKFSTSGDIIGDGYKIKNNLDVNLKYDAANIQYGAFYSFNNINVKNQTVENGNTYIKEVEGYLFQGVNTSKVYSINNYSGEISIDFKDYIENEDYKIFKKDYFGDDDYEFLKDKDGVVTFNVDRTGCVVGVVNLSDDLFFNASFEDLADGYVNKSQRMVGGDALIVCFPIMMISDEFTLYVFEEKTVEMKNRGELIKDVFDKAMGKELGMNCNVVHRYVSSFELNALSKIFNLISSGAYFDGLLAKEGVTATEEDKELYENIMSFFVFTIKIEGDRWQEDFVDSLIKAMETSYENTTNNDIDIKETEENKTEENNEKKVEFSEDIKVGKRYVSSFDMSKDALPFINIGTYISHGGNCAGFSQITAQLFNGNIYPKVGEKINFKLKSYKYDISNNEDLNTFFDKYLYDYKSRNYWSETYGDTETVKKEGYTESDRQFIEFLGYKCIEQNKAIQSKVHLMSGVGDHNLLFKNYNGEAFDNVIEYFKNNNKILSVALHSSLVGAHSVIAYGVEQDASDPDVWYILVYDNNFPNNKVELSNSVKATSGRIKVVKKTAFLGGSYIDWDYYPVSGYTNFRWTSNFDNSLTEWNKVGNAIMNAGYGLALFDDEYNIIFDSGAGD